MRNWMVGVSVVTMFAVATVAASPRETPEQGKSEPLVDATSVTKPDDTGPRPRPLVILYGSLGVLNGLDLISTHAALKNGAVETNPTMQGAAGMLMVRALSSGSAILVAEHLWKQNKMAAIATMVVANGLLAAVSLNNLHNATTGRK